MPDATIVIPQRNHGTLTRCLIQALRHHETQCWPTIVVDDGSDDGSAVMVQSSRFDACRIIEQPRRGVTAAWNAGIAQATTPYVVLLNNDVRTTGQFVHRLIDRLRIRQVLIVGAEWRIEPLIPHRVLAGWCFGFAVELWRKLGRFDETMQWYFSDTDFQCRAVECGCGLQCVDRLPLKHLGHRTTGHDSRRRAVWLSDRARFLEKWSDP